VSHNHLRNKLESLGITGKVLKWLEAYLKYHYQRVKIGDSFSDLCNVLSEVRQVPQGSGLGPLLFGIFINDLTECIQFSIPFYICWWHEVSASDEDTEKLQTDVSNATIWSNSSDLFFNESKFIHLRFFWKSTTDHPTYTVNGNAIKSLQLHKDLGVTLLSNFSWAARVNVVCRNIKVLTLS